MPDRPLDIDLTNSTNTRINQSPSPEDVNKFKAKLAQVLDRSMTVDRLAVDLPNDIDNFWCASDALSIAQAEYRGYTYDTTYATNNPLHKSADGKARVADVVHMIRPKWMKDEEVKMKAQRYIDSHMTDRRHMQKEERDFKAQNDNLGMGSIVESKAEIVSGSQIQESLNPSN